MNRDRSSVFERYPRLSGIVVFVIVFVSLDLLAGALFIPPNYQAFRIRHPYYHHDIEPWAETITNWGNQYYWFYSNSLGFRDSIPERIPLHGEKKRILFLGDSHTEGVGVDYEDSFPGILAKKLAGEGLEVLNGSAVSYSPKIYYLKCKYLLDEVGLDVDEIYVIIDLSDLNNEIAYKAFSPRNPGKAVLMFNRFTRKLSRVSFITYLGSRVVRDQRNRFFYKHMANSGDANYELYATFFSDFKNADLLNDPNFHSVSKWFEDKKYTKLAMSSLKLGQENILKLKELCDSRGIDLTLTVHPWQEQIIAGDTSNLYVDTWRKFCNEQGIDFINLFPVFINGENPVLVANHCYIPKDSHWNELGHLRVARTLYDHIMKKHHAE